MVELFKNRTGLLRGNPHSPSPKCAIIRTPKAFRDQVETQPDLETLYPLNLSALILWRDSLS